jgi:hypothetical protein
MTAAVTAALIGVTPALDAFRLGDFLSFVNRTRGCAFGMAIRSVGMFCDVRTRAVDVLRAMHKWYPCAMSNASDSLLQSTADAKMRAAEAVVSTAVQGDPQDPTEFWESLSTRAQSALKAFRSEMSERGGPNRQRLDVIRGAATNVQGAVNAGLAPASSATDAVRSKLKTAAAAAGALAIGATLAPFFVPLIVLILVERSGAGKRARGAARRYVSERASGYGF